MNLVCAYCGKTFKNGGARGIHEKKCSQNPSAVTPVKYECAFCKKICIGTEGLNNHQNHCKKNPNRKSHGQSKYKSALTNTCACKYCDKLFSNPGLLAAHIKICVLNPDRVYYDYHNRYENIRPEKKAAMAWCRGQTKETNQSVAMRSKSLEIYYQTHKGTFSGKHHTEDTKAIIGSQVSSALKKGYAEGTITPARGVGRGKYSYIVTPTKKYMLRSTYEFIFALYLLKIEQREFELEKVRVPALRQNKYASTFIADFTIGNIVIEVKGIPSGKDQYIRESFESAGYTFYELFEDSIQKCKEKLVLSGIDVDSLLYAIEEGHNSKNYFIYHIT